jgi:hypothetical protein
MIEARAYTTVGLFLAVLYATTVHAQFNEPELRSLSQTGAQSGSSIELTAVGDRLDEADRMHFSHPGIKATVKPGEPSTAYGNFVVLVDKDVPPGRYDAHVIGKHGVSNPRSFLVSDLPNVRPASISQNAKAPTPAAINSIVHGLSTASAIDYYLVQLSSQSMLHIEIIAQRIDSRMIGHIKLLSPQGRVLASSHGADEVDPKIVVKDLVPGDYIIALNDFLYRGGDDFQYQVAIRDNETAINLGLDRNRAPESFTARHDGLQTDTDRTASTPQKIELPYEDSWAFAVGHDANVFEFNAAQGDQYSIEVISQRLGEPTDARFVVQRMETDAAGTTSFHDILRSDDSFAINDGVINLTTKDPTALFVAPVAATYRVTIQDVDVGDSMSARQRFVLRIAKPEPSFDLACYRLYPHNDLNQSRPHGSKLARGGMETIRVMAARRDGWTGPIKISVEGLPGGVTCESTMIAANQNYTQLTLVAADDGPGGIASIRVMGHSEDNSIARQAIPMTHAVSKGGNREFNRIRVADEAVIWVSEKDIAPVTLRLAAQGTDPAGVAQVKKGETLNVAVTVTRRDGGQQPITLRPKDLPPGVTAPEITIAGDKADGTLVLTVTPDAAPGNYSFWSQGETNITPGPNLPAITAFLTSSTINFRIIDP